MTPHFNHLSSYYNSNYFLVINKLYFEFPPISQLQNGFDYLNTKPKTTQLQIISILEIFFFKKKTK